MAAPLRARYSVPQQQLFSASELRYVERRRYPLDAVCLGDFRIDRLFAGNSKESSICPAGVNPISIRPGCLPTYAHTCGTFLGASMEIARPQYCKKLS